MRDIQILNDVRQLFNAKLVPGGPWLHLATLLSTGREYCLFQHVPTGKVYLERVAKNQVNIVFEYIADENEYQELYQFAQEARLLSPTEDFKVALV